MRTPSAPLRAVLALAIALPLAAHAAEEEPGEDAMPTDPQGPADFEQQIQINDAQLEQFAAAYAAVRRVEEQYAERKEQAADEEELWEIEIEASGAMAQAMESSGLAMEEYNLISVHVNADPALREDVERRAEAAD